MIKKEKQYFTLTENHIKLIRNLWIEDYGEGPTVDPRRPYGNSDIEKDIVRILELPTFTDRYGEESFTEETSNNAIQYHREMVRALQIMCTLSDIKPGIYRQVEEWDSRSWEKV